MPRAVLSMAPEHHELESCPGGFVDLRRMSFGELLASEAKAYQVSMKQDSDKGDDPEIGMSMSRMAVLEFQFQTCILDHNLEDDKDQKLNLKAAAHIHGLDPRIGQEIANLIEKMHKLEKLAPNSETSSSSESSVAESPSEDNGVPQQTISPTSSSE